MGKYFQQCFPTQTGVKTLGSKATNLPASAACVKHEVKYNGHLSLLWQVKKGSKFNGHGTLFTCICRLIQQFYTTMDTFTTVSFYYCHYNRGYNHRCNGVFYTDLVPEINNDYWMVIAW